MATYPWQWLSSQCQAGQQSAPHDQLSFPPTCIIVIMENLFTTYLHQLMYSLPTTYLHHLQDDPCCSSCSCLPYHPLGHLHTSGMYIQHVENESMQLKDSFPIMYTSSLCRSILHYAQTYTILSHTYHTITHHRAYSLDEALMHHPNQDHGYGSGLLLEEDSCHDNRTLRNLFTHQSSQCAWCHESLEPEIQHSGKGRRGVQEGMQQISDHPIWNL